MRLLHDDEFACVEHLLEHKGKPFVLSYSDIQYMSGYFGARYTGVHIAFTFLLELEKVGLIKITSSKIDWSSHFDDTFLKKYSDLVKNENIEEAKKLATSMELELLNSTLEKQETLGQTRELINKLLEKRDLSSESSFSEDLYDAIRISIEVSDELETYLEKYLEEFRNDNLIKPKSSKDEWDRIRYFEQEFYRYKKQRQILLDVIKAKLETQSPSKVKINYDELPKEHLNEGELFACLEREGLIKDGSYEFGGFDDKDKPHWLLQVDEEKIQDIPSDNKIKLNLSFSPTTGVLTLIDQGGKEYKIKVQGQVQKEVMRVIFQFQERVSDEWSLYEISEMLGKDDADTTAVKNAIYQINKKVKLKIPEIEKLFEYDKHSAQLNSKYLLSKQT